MVLTNPLIPNLAKGQFPVMSQNLSYGGHWSTTFLSSVTYSGVFSHSARVYGGSMSVYFQTPAAKIVPATISGMPRTTGINLKPPTTSALSGQREQDRT